MAGKFLARVILAMALGGGVWAGLARVEGSELFPKTPPGATELPPGYPPVDSSPSRRPLRDWWRYGRPLGCWSSFNGYGCGSWHADAAFLFGSCRTFFGEPCLKGAPPSALPPWAGPESGYYGPAPGRAPAGGQPGCRCW